MIQGTDLGSLAGRTMHGPDGSKIGKIVDVYESTDGSQATFVTVATGLFGTGASFVPLAEATMAGDDVVVPYDKALVKDAPRVDADQELTAEEEDRLYRHYHLFGDTPAAGTGAGVAAAGTGAGVAAAGTAATGAGTDRDRTDVAMTRSEERLQVGVQRREAGRARLRKYVTSETVTQTVPVSHEEVRIDRTPIPVGERDAMADGATLSEQTYEVVLTAEHAVVAKSTVPVEQVRLDTHVVQEQVTVTEQVRKENIELEVEGDPSLARGPRSSEGR